MKYKQQSFKLKLDLAIKKIKKELKSFFEVSASLSGQVRKDAKAR